MHLLVLCANVGTQHYNLHSRVLAVARAWPGPAAVVACAQDGRRHVAWRPGQRACAGRVGSWVHHCVLEGKFSILDRAIEPARPLGLDLST